MLRRHLAGSLLLMLLVVFTGCQKHRPGSLPGTWKGSAKGGHQLTFGDDGTYEEYGEFFGITVTVTGTYTYTPKGVVNLTPSDVKSRGLKDAALTGLKEPRKMTIDFTTPDSFFDPDGLAEGKGEKGELFTRQHQT